MLLLTLTIIFLNSGQSYGAKYECEISENGSRCEIPKLNLTRENFSIEPVTEDPSAIKKIQLFGTVTILSSGICEALPILEFFDAHGVSTEEIKENAFEGCKNVWYLDLQNNFLLYLGGNVFNGLLNLKQLWLNSNVLFDLEIEKLLEHTPNLENISLAENNFNCGRLHEIHVLLQTKNIYADPGVEEARTRNNNTEEIEKNDCITQLHWEALYELLSPEQQALVHINVTRTADDAAVNTNEEADILDK